MSEENNLQVSKQSDEQFCSSCGKPIKIKAEICPHCGVRQIPVNEVGTSEKGWLSCLLLFLFLGWLGAHRFYVGKVGTALLYIITLGGLGVWARVDFILIVVGNFKDNEGKPVRR